MDQFKPIKTLLALSTVSILLAACSSDGNNNPDQPNPTPPVTLPTVTPEPTANTGTLEGPITGISFTTDSIEGETSATGTFNYESSENISFNLGAIEFNTPSTAYPHMTTLDFVESDATNGNAAAINITRLLMSLDDNENLDDGVQITQDVIDQASDNFDFDQPSDDFTTNIATYLEQLSSGKTGGARALTSSEDAIEYLSNLVLPLYAGSYEGEYTSDSIDSGTWSFSVTDAGIISGSATSETTDTVYELNGAITDAIAGTGTAQATAQDVEAVTWSLTFNRHGQVEGTWGEGDNSGTLTGSQPTPTPSTTPTPSVTPTPDPNATPTPSVSPTPTPTISPTPTATPVVPTPPPLACDEGQNGDQFSISLSWTLENSDFDLHVYEPSGQHIYFGLVEGINGSLSEDEVFPGPEIYTTYPVCDAISEGTYGIIIHYLEDFLATDGTETRPGTAVLTLNLPTGSQSFSLNYDAPFELDENNLSMTAELIVTDNDGSFEYEVQIIE